MLPHEILALDELQVQIQEQLFSLIAIVVDYCISNGIFGGGLISEKILECSPVAQDQVLELLVQLVALGGDDDGQFKKFCGILCEPDVKQDDLGELLLAQSAEIRRNGGLKTKARAAECSLVKASFTVEDHVHTTMNKHGLGRTTEEDRTVECIPRVEKHFKRLCRNRYGKSDSASLSLLDADAGDSYVALSVQAVTTRHIEDLSEDACNGERPDRGLGTLFAPDTETFDLENTGRLLQSLAQARRSSSSSVGLADTLEHSCVLIGGTGQGKTMACQRIMMEVMEESVGGPTNLYGKFRFVVYVSCRDEADRVKSTDCKVLLGLNHASLDLSDEEQDLALRFLSENSRDMLILLDGIDSVGQEGLKSGSAALALLTRQSCLLEARVIVTSRACRQVQALLPHCAVHYRLCGLSAKKLEEFCVHRLGETEGGKCVGQLRESSDTRLEEAVLHTPLFAALLCQQYDLTQSIPSSIDTFYSDYVDPALAELQGRKDLPAASS